MNNRFLQTNIWINRFRKFSFTVGGSKLREKTVFVLVGINDYFSTERLSLEEFKEQENKIHLPKMIPLENKNVYHLSASHLSSIESKESQ